MEPIYPLILLILLCWLLSIKGKNSYKNIYAAIVSVASSLVCIIAGIVTEAAGVSLSGFYLPAALLPTVATLVAEIIVRIITRSDGYFTPYRYVNGKFAPLINVFYERENVNFYLRGQHVFTRFLLLALAASELIAGVLITALASSSAPVPLAHCSVVTMLLMSGLFLCGTTKVSQAEKKFRRVSAVSNSSDNFRANYEFPDDYEFIFRKYNATEKNHIIYSTIHNYRIKRMGSESIRLYDFEKKCYSEFTDYEQNDILGEFVKSNGIEPNETYIQVFSLLDKGYNVLMKSASYADFDPYIAALIKKKTADTYKTVVVVDTHESGNGFISRFHRVFREYFGFSALPVIRRFEDVLHEYEEEPFREEKINDIDRVFERVFSENAEDVMLPDKLRTDVIVLTPEDILDADNAGALRKFAGDINFIIYYDFSECVHEETLMCKIVHSVLDPDDSIGTLYMTDGFFDFRQAINNFFSVRPFYEVVVPRKVPRKSYCTVWKYENAEEFQERTITNPSLDFGMHPVLAVYGRNHIQNNCMIIADENDIYAESFSMFASTEENSSKVDCFVGWKDIIDGKYVYCTVTDRYNNIPHTYLAVRGIGSEREYVNIISKPYLLREYLAYFSKHFSVVPDALTSFSAAVINTNRANALECIIKAFLVGCTEKQIRDYAIKLRIDYSKTADKLLEDILKETNLLRDSSIPMDIRQDGERYYINKEVYLAIIEKTEFVRKIYFSVNNHETVCYYKDFRYLVPHQKIVLEGNKYTVEKINGDHVELSDSQAREALYVSRIVRKCRAYSVRSKSTVEYSSNNNTSSMEMSTINCDLDVDIYGRISFKDDYSFDETKRMNNYMYTKAKEIFSNHYEGANVLRLKFRFPQDITRENRDPMAHTMALLINEMLPTFFPRHSERVVVACSGWNEEITDNAADINLDYIVAPFILEDEEEIADDEFCVYMFEDSEIETGVINVFWQDEEIRYIFNILEDYLYFIEVIDRDVLRDMFGTSTDKPLHELRKALLHLIDHPLENSNAQYANRIRRTRDTFNEKRLLNTYSMVCDFCGKPIKESNSANPYVFYHYSGLRSCPQCAATAVSSKNHEVVSDCVDTVKRWVEKNFNESIQGPAFDSVEDVDFINKYANPMQYYAVTDDVDYGVAGFAQQGASQVSVVLTHDEEEMLRVCHGNSGDRVQPSGSECEDWPRSGYFVDNANIILIESGLPRFRHESIQAHELTHQWQYEHLDMGLVMMEPYSGTIVNEFGLKVDMTDFRIEGQSSWVEWRYLQQHGHRKEAAALRRSLLNRNDEYGIGFRWFCNLMRVGGTDIYSKIPRDRRFRHLRLRYQIQKNPYKIMQLYFGGGAEAVASSEE